MFTKTEQLKIMNKYFKINFALSDIVIIFTVVKQTNRYRYDTINLPSQLNIK